MNDILLFVIVVGVFAFGYFVMDRFGRLADANSGVRKAGGRKARVTVKAIGNLLRGKAASDEINTLSDLFGDGEYEVIIVDKEASHLIRYPEGSCFQMKLDL